jgi:hypothetical protein
MKNINSKPLLLLFIVPMLMGCPKRRVNIAPPVDQELQSTRDITFAAEVISDVDMICSFIGEEDMDPSFYVQQPVSGSGTVTAIRNTLEDKVILGFNRTRCMDGKIRDGSVNMEYRNANPNAGYYPEYGFEGRVTLLEYKVNGWLIKTTNGEPCVVKNLLSSPAYNPAQTKLSWSISGSFDFTHPADPSRNMTWKGTIIKTLANTADPDVFAPDRASPIKWSRAVVNYQGMVTGFTSGNVPYQFEMSAKYPLTRDFTCYPEKVGGVISTDPVVRTWNIERHPFVSGVASFTTGALYPRQIYYGNEDSDLSWQCDNSGVVLIKGILYKVDFEK